MKRYLLVLARYLGPSAYFVLDKLCVLDFVFRPKRGGIERKVLIVRTDNIGDYVLWRNFAAELIRHFNGQAWSIDLAVNAVWAELAASDFPAATVIPIVRGKMQFNIAYRFGVLRRIRATGYAQVLHPVFSREFAIGDSIVRASTAKATGFRGDMANRTALDRYLGDYCYRQLIDLDNHLPAHELFKHQVFLAAVGVAAPASMRPALGRDQALLPAAVMAVVQGRDYAVIAPGASWEGKQWPMERYAAIATWLQEEYGWRIVLVGGAEDRHLAQHFSASAVINLCGETPLHSVTPLMARAKLILSNDSSAVHFAFAAGVPAVCVLGGGHFGRFLPYPTAALDAAPSPAALYSPMDCYGCNWRCQYPRVSGDAVECIRRVSVAAMQQQIRQCLAQALHGQDVSH